MTARCCDKKHKMYAYYGGRGIKICKEWQHTSKRFLEDMGECPDGYQLDRIDSNGDYCADNCRWVTPKENAKNRRNNVMIKYDGFFLCLSEWSRKLGIPIPTLHKRIFRRKWTIKDAFTVPSSSIIGRHRKDGTNNLSTAEGDTKEIEATRALRSGKKLKRKETIR